MKASRWLLLIALFALSCGKKSVDTDGPGELAVQVIWDEAPVVPAKIAEAPAGVVTMRFTIQPRQVRFECPASYGSIDSPILAPGIYSLVAEGLDNQRTITHRGYVSNIEIMSGKTTVVTVALKGSGGFGGTMEMVWIEPGTFTMGSRSSESGRDSDEGLQHQVTITKGFWLGKFEIAQGEWEAVMGTRPWAGQSYVQENPNNPAVYISWNDVQAFVAKLNEVEGSEVYRLPTEAEWEYACRAGTTTRWSFGDNESWLGRYAWYYDNAWNVGEKYAHAAGARLPNPWELYDMHGNVWEWCQDWYGSYLSSSQTDPTGPATGSSRVLRGGSFSFRARDVRSAARSGGSPDSRGNHIGARLLRQGQ